MSGHGHQIFTDGLMRLATHTGAPRLAALARRVGAPATVAVHGRHGVGVSTVTEVLTAAGVRVRDADIADADIDVRVVAEVVKPEDLAALRTGRPTLTVLNKADLAGFGAGGPVPTFGGATPPPDVIWARRGERPVPAVSHGTAPAPGSLPLHP